jgi:hypothetical protein
MQGNHQKETKQKIKHKFVVCVAGDAGEKGTFV